MSDIGPQWQTLCEEHEAARDAYLRAFAAVNEKFSALGKGTSNANPTNAELTEFDKTRHAWQDVIRRVGEFVKRYTEGGQKLGWPAELGR
ncbi:MAG: hypothetical protein E6H52_09575 [Betaproteobacteria bacterium]|jgi:hypothetical protein|nr:MAG: hypothetical protein E6H52_09575 [Betaproteobacteria bacterium]